MIFMTGLPLADSPMPVMDVAWAILLVSRVLHIAGAGAIFGGLVYLKRVVAPLATDASDKEEALYRGRRSAWAGIVMAATALLLLSGTLNIYTIVVGSEKMPAPYHMMFGVKFLLAMFVFFVAAGTAGKSPMATNMQASARKWLNLAIGALLLIFALGAAMRTFEKTPRAAVPDQARNSTLSASDCHG